MARRIYLKIKSDSELFRYVWGFDRYSRTAVYRHRWEKELMYFSRANRTIRTIG